ncbi:MAG: hypothetical protein ACOCYE_09575 [Pseudomonadota bacterium]
MTIGVAGAQDFPRREPVDLPPEVEAVFRAQMLTHIVSLNDILKALAKGEYEAAAVVVDGGMGIARGAGLDLTGATEPGGEAGPGLGYGRYMPEKFITLGNDFHEAANAFAELARSLPAEPSAEQHLQLTGALADVTSQCAACHDSFMVR